MEGFDRICTGVAGLDSQLGGGVPPGTSILLIAESTNALYQFLDETAAFGLDQGQDVVWMELDRPFSVMERSIEANLDGGVDKLTVLNAYEPHIGDTSTNGQGNVGMETITAATVPDEATKRMSELEPDNYRFVLTSLSTLLQSHSVDDVLSFLRQMVALNQEMGGLQIFTVVKDAHPPEVIAKFKHVCTGVFELGMERKGFGLYSYLKIEKLLGVPDSTKLMLFNETDEGLRLESTKRVF